MRQTGNMRQTGDTRQTADMRQERGDVRKGVRLESCDVRQQT